MLLILVFGGSLKRTHRPLTSTSCLPLFILCACSEGRCPAQRAPLRASCGILIPMWLSFWSTMADCILCALTFGRYLDENQPNIQDEGEEGRLCRRMSGRKGDSSGWSRSAPPFLQLVPCLCICQLTAKPYNRVSDVSDQCSGNGFHLGGSVTMCRIFFDCSMWSSRFAGIVKLLFLFIILSSLAGCRELVSWLPERWLKIN